LDLTPFTFTFFYTFIRLVGNADAFDFPYVLRPIKRQKSAVNFHGQKIKSCVPGAHEDDRAFLSFYRFLSSSKGALFFGYFVLCEQKKVTG
jgi:hypothetical protein